MNVTEIFLQALAHHKKGDLREAESLYRAILADQPLHPDANHNLGAIARQVGKLDASLPYFQRAIEANPVQGLFWSSYVSALIDLGQSASGDAGGSECPAGWYVRASAGRVAKYSGFDAEDGC